MVGGEGGGTEKRDSRERQRLDDMGVGGGGGWVGVSGERLPQVRDYEERKGWERSAKFTVSISGLSEKRQDDEGVGPKH